jgi:hypothetical protein
VKVTDEGSTALLQNNRPWRERVLSRSFVLQQTKNGRKGMNAMEIKAIVDQLNEAIQVLTKTRDDAHAEVERVKSLDLPLDEHIEQVEDPFATREFARSAIESIKETIEYLEKIPS